MDQKSRQIIADLYTGQFEQYGNDIRSLAAPEAKYGKKHQNHKFSILAPYIGKEESVLDVGSGLADLCGYLRGCGWEGQYTGLDLSEKLIGFSKKRFPDERFYNLDILEEDLKEPFDHVVCVSTIQEKPVYEDAADYLRRMVTKMFSLASKTVIFDVFSSKFADYFEDNAVYAGPSDMLDFCYGLTNRLVLINNYNPYQMMVVLYKEQLRGWMEFNEE